MDDKNEAPQQEDKEEEEDEEEEESEEDEDEDMNGGGDYEEDQQEATARGTNPQNLIEKILRNRIFDNAYWKEHCFSLTSATLVDKAVELKEVGGTYGALRKPTPFIMLLLRMLQIAPEKEIVVEFIRNEEFRYVRLLGATYLRLVGQPVDIYQFLEPLYNDFRRVVVAGPEGKTVSHVDEFVWDLLHSNFACDISLPRIPKRCVLEKMGLLERRVSALEDDPQETSTQTQP